MLRTRIPPGSALQVAISIGGKRPCYLLFGLTEHEDSDFRRAVESDRGKAGGAAADVHHRARGAKDARRIANAMKAWGQNWSNDWQAHLAAVIVTGEHEIEIVLLRPTELIRCVGDKEAE